MELRGIETAPTWAPSGADRRENAGTNTPKDDEEPRGISASGSAPLASADDAIRAAAKLAIEAGDYQRARVLIDLLEKGGTETSTGSDPSAAGFAEDTSRPLPGLAK